MRGNTMFGQQYFYFLSDFSIIRGFRYFGRNCFFGWKIPIALFIEVCLWVQSWIDTTGIYQTPGVNGWCEFKRSYHKV
jgi:hypothetical protein